MYFLIITQSGLGTAQGEPPPLPPCNLFHFHSSLAAYPTFGKILGFVKCVSKPSRNPRDNFSGPCFSVTFPSGINRPSFFFSVSFKYYSMKAGFLFLGLLAPVLVLLFWVECNYIVLDLKPTILFELLDYYLDTTHRSGITFRSTQISHPFLIQFTPYFVHDTQYIILYIKRRFFRGKFR